MLNQITYFEAMMKSDGRFDQKIAIRLRKGAIFHQSEKHLV